MVGTVQVIERGASWYWLALGVLAVWRVTHLLQAEDGPWDLVVRLRGWAGSSFFGKLLDCFYCLSLWIAAPVAALLGEGPKQIGLLWLALSGGAIVIERVSHRTPPVPPAVYWSEGEDPDVLRKEEAGRGDGASDGPGEERS